MFLLTVNVLLFPCLYYCNHDIEGLLHYPLSAVYFIYELQSQLYVCINLVYSKPWSFSNMVFMVLILQMQGETD